MAFTPVTFAPVENRKFLIREANGFLSRDEVWINVGSADLSSGAVLGGPSTLKAATDVSPLVYGQYNPSAVQGFATVAGILLDATKLDEAGVGIPHKASGRFTFSAQPSASGVIAVNGVNFTFVASGATGAQINIGADLAATMVAAAAVLNASANASVNVATYYATDTTIEIVYDTAGTAGNAFTTATGSGTHNATALAATLLGGGYIVKGVIINRDAEVKEGELTWFAGASAGQKTTGLAALRALGIKARPYPTTEITS